MPANVPPTAAPERLAELPECRAARLRYVHADPLAVAKWHAGGWASVGHARFTQYWDDVITALAGSQP